MSRGPRSSWVVGCVMAAMSLHGCGARTGLLVPDVVRDAPDVVDAVCMPSTFVLARRSAEVLFVVDRSNSMNLDLDGREPMLSGQPPRWRVLREALNVTLPMFQNTLAMGASFYPFNPPMQGSPAEFCRVQTNVDVSPAVNNAAAIVNVIDTTEPGGGTPTYEALRTATQFLASRGGRERARYIVLATDGGPNCDGSQDPNRCVCTSRDPNTGLPNCPDIGEWGPFNCLDDRRTINMVAEAFRQSIPTFVIGIDDPSRPELTDVLNQLAINGGRPNMTGRTRYYSARRSDDLVSAFDAIQRTITRCSFVAPSMPADPEGITLEVNGVMLTRDTTRNNGWDWTNVNDGEVGLFGATCAQFADSPVLNARFGCSEPR